MSFKKTIGKLHLWLGLSTGLIVFIVSITGAMYVFKEEIQGIIRKEYIYHQEPNIDNKNTLPLRKMEALVNQQTHERYPLHWVEIPLNKAQSYKFVYHESNKNGWNYFDRLVIYKTVYVNPFNGKVLAVFDEKNGFFNIVKFIHWSLLLRNDWGKYIVGIPVLIFIISLISGIILWWPKNKSAAKQRFWFSWKNVKNWRRKNYDLHNVLGFYSSFFALIIAITGIFYSFFAVKALIYFTFSGGQTKYPDFSTYKTSAPIEQRSAQTIDRISQQVEQRFPHAYGYRIDLGQAHLDDHKHENLSVFVKELSYSYHKNHNLIFDENSGKLLHVHKHQDKNLGEKAIAANYDIHVGSIFGIWSKILAFVVSLICASLPVSGFLIWWGRRKKKNVTSSKKQILTETVTH